MAVTSRGVRSEAEAWASRREGDAARPARAAATVRRRRPLPGGRAVLGGFLVALAAVGTFAAQRAATAPVTSRWLVASHTLPAGATLTHEDLAETAVDLPASMRRRAFQSERDVIGLVLVATLGPGDLIQSSAVGRRAVAPGEREVSFAVDPTRSLGDRIAVGDLVDVLATYGQGHEARTDVVVQAARVIDRQDRSGAIGGAPGYIYTVTLVRPEDVTALTTASVAGALSVVRSSVAAVSGNPLPTTPTTGAAPSTPTSASSSTAPRQQAPSTTVRG